MSLEDLNKGSCMECFHKRVKLTEYPCSECEAGAFPWSMWKPQKGEETMPPKKKKKKTIKETITENLAKKKKDAGLELYEKFTEVINVDEALEFADDINPPPPDLEILYHPVKSLAGTGKEYMKAQAKAPSPTLLHIQIPCKSVNRDYGATFDLCINYKLYSWLKKQEHSLNSLSTESGDTPVKYFPIQIRHKHGRIVIQIVGEPTLNREYGFRGKWGKVFVKERDVYRFIKENCS